MITSPATVSITQSIGRNTSWRRSSGSARIATAAPISATDTSTGASTGESQGAGIRNSTSQVIGPAGQPTKARSAR
jgi:hypothetical protein